MSRNSYRLHAIRFIYFVLSTITLSALSIAFGMLTSYTGGVLAVVFNGSCILFAIAVVCSVVASFVGGYDLVLSYFGEEDV